MDKDYSSYSFEETIFNWAVRHLVLSDLVCDYSMGSDYGRLINFETLKQKTAAFRQHPNLRRMMLS